MSALLADTYVWSLAFRNDTDPANTHVSVLRDRLTRGSVVTTGVVCQELLRGFTRQATRDEIRGEFGSLRFIEPARDDYLTAADLSLTCSRAGVQLDTVDALIAQVCIANDLQLLTADGDFLHAARHVPLDVWTPA